MGGKVYREPDYHEPDYVLVPIRDFNFCEKCGKMYGNCEHHPITVPRNLMTKKEIKELMKDHKPEWKNLDKLIRKGNR